MPLFSGVLPDPKRNREKVFLIFGLLLKTIVSILMPNLVKEVEMKAVFHPVHALWTEVIVGRLEGQL